MRSIDKKIDNVFAGFRQVYLSKDSAGIGDRWRRNVMDRIRTLGPVNSRPQFFVLFEEFIWKLAPVSCALLILLVIILSQFDFSTDTELLSRFINNGDELSLREILEI